MEFEPISGTFYRARSLLVGYDCLEFLIKVGGESGGGYSVKFLEIEYATIFLFSDMEFLGWII